MPTRSTRSSKGLNAPMPVNPSGPVPDKSRQTLDAGRACALIEETIQDLERGKLATSSDADTATFIISGGRLAGRPRIVSTPFQTASVTAGEKPWRGLDETRGARPLQISP